MVPEIYTTTSRQFCSFYTGFLYMSVLNSRSCCLPPSIFEKKMVLVWGRSEPRRCCQPPTLPLNYAEKMRETIFPKSRVHIKDNNNSPHVKLHQFLFPFSGKFLDLNFVLFVLYWFTYVIWNLYVTQIVSLGYLWFRVEIIDSCSVFSGATRGWTLCFLIRPTRFSHGRTASWSPM